MSNVKKIIDAHFRERIVDTERHVAAGFPLPMHVRRSLTFYLETNHIETSALTDEQLAHTALEFFQLRLVTNRLSS